jgi:hypothetical protein
MLEDYSAIFLCSVFTPPCKLTLLTPGTTPGLKCN